MTLADEELAVLARAGDRRAFDRLVTRHKEPLYRFVRRYVGNPAEAQDVLQDSFIAAWTGLRRYDPARAFGPWLRAVTLNKCRDWSRRQKVRHLFLGRWAVETSVTPEDEALVTQAEERSQRLDRAIAHLPPALKEPLLLTVTLGMSHEEAATALATTGKSVEMRLYRARQRLREDMA